MNRSYNKFSDVWSDMALEQSVNCHSKSKPGVIGFSKHDRALDRWFLTADERAAMISASQQMCGIKDEEGTHKEAGSQRV